MVNTKLKKFIARQKEGIRRAKTKKVARMKTRTIIQRKSLEQKLSRAKTQLQLAKLRQEVSRTRRQAFGQRTVGQSLRGVGRSIQHIGTLASRPVSKKKQRSRIDALLGF